MIKILRLFSRKTHKVNFTKCKVDPWIKEKVNSAKVLTLAELEEL